jgi:hypothetical protein
MIASLLLGTLVAILLLVLRMLLVLVMLRVLAMVPLIGWPLVALLKTLLGISTWASVAPRSLPLELPLLGIHLLALIVNHNITVH